MALAWASMFASVGFLRTKLQLLQPSWGDCATPLACSGARPPDAVWLVAEAEASSAGAAGRGSTHTRAAQKSECVNRLKDNAHPHRVRGGGDDVTLSYTPATVKTP